MMSIRDPELTQWVLHRVRPTPSERIPRRIHIGARVATRFRIRACGVGRSTVRNPLVTELRSQPNWRFRELPALNHLDLFLAPDLIADALMGLAVRGG